LLIKIRFEWLWSSMRDSHPSSILSRMLLHGLLITHRRPLLYGHLDANFQLAPHQLLSAPPHMFSPIQNARAEYAVWQVRTSTRLPHLNWLNLELPSRLAPAGKAPAAFSPNTQMQWASCADLIKLHPTHVNVGVILPWTPV
jgi:hypothetical protein